jgi:hypothetical protein
VDRNAWEALRRSFMSRFTGTGLAPASVQQALRNKAMWDSIFLIRNRRMCRFAFLGWLLAGLGARWLVYARNFARMGGLVGNVFCADSSPDQEAFTFIGKRTANCPDGCSYDVGVW